MDVDEAVERLLATEDEAERLRIEATLVAQTDNTPGPDDPEEQPGQGVDDVDA
ncbi:MAG TPA: hypothetical protein VIK95_05795 [Egibacteraceae bacterium]